jgi:hypothetical protein
MPHHLLPRSTTPYLESWMSSAVVTVPQKRAPVKVPRVVLSLSLSENRRGVGTCAHALTVIYAVRK